MSNAARQQSHALHLLRLQQHLLRLTVLGDIAQDAAEFVAVGVLKRG